VEQVAAVKVDAALLPDATATLGVSVVDASPNHLNQLSPIK